MLIDCKYTTTLRKLQILYQKTTSIHPQAIGSLVDKAET
jgi:hypothetical protein